MKKIYVLFVLCFCFSLYSVNPVYSQNTGESKINQIDVPYACEEDLIEIMFDWDSQVRLRNGSLFDLKSNALMGLDLILNQFNNYTWFRISDVAEETIDNWSINGERNTGKPVYNLNNIYRLQIPKDLNIWETSAMLEELPGVLLARPVPKPMELPIPSNYQSSQGYLNPASSTPTGIDAAYAWTQTGGTGTGVTICDLEYSWNYNHNDILKAAGSQINTNTADPPPYAGPNHGTAVIGQLVADNNGWGTTGICYGANLKTCGTYYGTPSPSWNVPGAMAVAIASLSAGDIILLEQQWDYDGNSSTLDFLPIEWWLNYSPSAQTFNGVYAAITNAISNGIHVVEAGGNGAQNTDLLTWYGNSGAIIVGAGGAYSGGTYPYGDLQKLWFSSYGSRFDLQGWGENVVTTGYGDLYGLEGTNYWYTNSFSGTSSASPIVAGALACAQGYYKANYITPLSPASMLAHLKLHGTAQITPPIGNIGPRPNLYAAINNFTPPAQTLDFGDLPNSFLTSLGSNGARHLIGNYFLGSLIDAESDGIPSPNADNDDNSGIDDEDGVVFTNILTPGGTTNITVTASIGGGLLQCWIDYNNNGFFDIPSEEVFLNQPLVAGPNNLSFTTPASAIIGSTYARFRFSSSLYFGLIFYSYCADGEVEDYKVDIETNQGSSLKWEQLPDLSPTGMDVDATLKLEDPPPILLADDFLCTETGNITDIHIWGSWLNDYLPFFEDPAAVQFTFSIHSDIPDPDGAGPEYSMPGELLWMRTWIPTYDDIEEIFSGDEDWYNPFYPMWLDDNHQMCYKYNYILDPQDYFLQEGTAENPIVYWLDVQAEPFDQDPNCRFGWKTSLDHWNDDAVWIDAIEQYEGFWHELRYPLGHEFETESVDLAFQITTEGGPTEELDFGDAPEDALAYPSLGIVGNFPTCVSVPVAGWIEHQTMDLFFNPGFDLENEGNAGLCPSFNPGQYNQDECFADGDAGLIVPDGFTIVGPIGSETVQPCTGANNQHLGYTCTNALWGPDIDIDVYNYMANGNQGYLNVFIDWNQDGQWSGFSNCPGYAVPEHALIDFPIPYGYSGPVSGLMAVGTTLAIGANTGYVWARFTLTDVPVGSDWDGAGSFEDGETEDYLLLILGQEEEFDFGDASDPMYPTLLGSGGANHLLDGTTYLGLSVDPEPDGQQTPFADGDDMDGNDDEDGISFDWPLTVGNPCKITVNASVANGLFSGWIDFDGNGSWADPGEHVFGDMPLTAGDNDLHFIVPPTATAGLITYARFRFSTQAGLSFTGPAIDGEVEDYEVTIDDFGEYKWAQYPDTSLPGLHAHDYLLPPYQSIVVADDWLCNGGLVTDIHWWGNYELDPGGQELRGAGIDHFHISIHADDPTGSCKPLPEIVGFDVYFPPLVEQNTGLVNTDGCSIYKYDFILPTPFQQEEGTRYWVDISAFSSDPTNPAYWRWQESMRSSFPILCGAVDKVDPSPGTWNYIFWPGNPVEQTDMAFIITSVEAELMDFGDARDPGYPTLLASNGAAHIIDTTMYLGNSIDYEPDGIPHPNALGDDNTGIDDEDGVTLNPIFPIIPGGTPWFNITASKPGKLNVWVDWNANDSWGDAGEQAQIDFPLVAGLNTVQINVPANAIIGTTYARFRYSSAIGISYNGIASDGEVEDYEIIIEGDVDVNLKAFLEGPFDGTAMDTDLNSNNLIPFNQPYNSDPTAKWYYTGTESVSSIPNANVVDWVIVEFRDAPTAAVATGATMVSQQAAFILNDGNIVGLDGVSPVKTNGIYQYGLYVVIWQRNHLGVMSAIPIVPSGINQYSYDFTTALGQAYLNGQKDLGGGTYGLMGGDGQPDGSVDSNDQANVWEPEAGNTGYEMGDYNMDTQVDNNDKDDVWYLNNTSGTQVPN